jgi:hypothetical protein
MVAVHEHLGFDDRDESGLLAQGRIASQRLRIGFDAGPAGDPFAPASTLIPGMIPASIRTLTKGMPALVSWWIVSS